MSKNWIEKSTEIELRKVDGFEFRITKVMVMNYSGKYEFDGYDVFLGLLKLRRFYGFPVNEDIKPLIPKRMVA